MKNLNSETANFSWFSEVFKQFKHLVSLLIIIAFISGCSNKGDKVPRHIMPPDSMTLFIKEMQIVEATLLHLQESSMDANAYRDLFFDSLFESHNTTEERFEESLLFYSKNLDLLNEIYADVVSELSQELIYVSGGKP